jgi:hypothetical protein
MKFNTVDANIEHINITTIYRDNMMKDLLTP